MCRFLNLHYKVGWNKLKRKEEKKKKGLNGKFRAILCKIELKQW